MTGLTPAKILFGRTLRLPCDILFGRRSETPSSLNEYMKNLEERLESEKEEHLLPPPYQTDCAENGPSEDAKASTNTNSFQMCLDMCRSEYAKARYGCDVGMRMVSSVRDLCLRNHVPPHITHKQQSELQNNLLICFQNCKQGCLKLQYKYRIKETEDYEGKDLSL
ncbi:hypothetical protein AVEN_49589-1 [Araneus ventricosus]|uniref:Uncharacterized protein n=1 Tax=Araneus ventricosus TaxID=182803 RepID=A0A4Y2LXL9_ARAVE|nr:hypothetical protein AVEN_49589-1 [Araneus ventricosus]